MKTHLAVAAALIAGASLFGSLPAHAHGNVQWSVTIGTPSYPPPGVVVWPQSQYIYGAPPAAFAPPPVIYVQPAPVYRFYPPVQYVDPYGQPLYPRRDFRDHHRSNDWNDGHRPGHWGYRR